MNQPDSPALTEEERDLLYQSGELWNAWCRLGQRTENDDTEFMHHLHALQSLMALRVARRVDPDMWRQPEDKRRPQ